jgi:hypothetical protein
LVTEVCDGSKAIPRRKIPRGEIILNTPLRRAIFLSGLNFRACQSDGDDAVTPRVSSRAFADGSERSSRPDVCPDINPWRNGMKRLGVSGATALSLSLAIATPVLAQEGGKAAGGHAGAAMGARAGGANAGGARMGGPRMGSVGAQANFRGGQTFRGGQANVGGANFAGRGNAQFAQGNFRGGEFRGDRGRGFRRDIAAGAVAAGVATAGAVALGSGYYNDGYYDPNYAYGDNYTYGDSYAYNDGSSYDAGIPLVTFDQSPAQVGGDPASCAQRYRSYDPASGTYLGFDGLRHPCL